MRGTGAMVVLHRGNHFRHHDEGTPARDDPIHDGRSHVKRGPRLPKF
jgi:hypothetical protein